MTEHCFHDASNQCIYRLEGPYIELRRAEGRKNGRGVWPYFPRHPFCFANFIRYLVNEKNIYMDELLKLQEVGSVALKRSFWVADDYKWRLAMVESGFESKAPSLRQAASNIVCSFTFMNEEPWPVNKLPFLANHNSSYGYFDLNSLRVITNISDRVLLVRSSQTPKLASSCSALSAVRSHG